MAETTGLILGVASFAGQVASGIEKLRSTIKYNRTQAPQDLACLRARLEILQGVLNTIQTSHTDPLVSLIVTHCHHTYAGLDAQLNKVLERFPPKSASGRQYLRSKVRQTIADNRANIEALQTEVSRVTQFLMLTQIPLSMPPPLQTLGVPYESSVGGHNESHSGAITRQVTPTETFKGLMVNRPRRAICSCPGPSAISKSGSFWWLHYSTNLFARQGCDSEECIQRRLLLNLRVAFIRFGFPRAFTASLEYVTGSHSSSIRPALTTQQIVRRTSPVFAELWKVENGISTFQESRDVLRVLFKTNSHFQRHADAEGHSYLWHLVRYGPWVKTDREAQFKMLELFCTEFDMSFSREDPSLLNNCARWIGEGPHLDLLESVLEYGFEPYESVAPAASAWPEPCDDNWISLRFTADPFFVEYFTTIVKVNPDFSGITDFQVLLLTEQYERIRMHLSRPSSRQMIQEVNFLQQTSLHMAVGQPLLLQSLVDFLDDQSAINAKDHWAFTPLMYAAASGYTESAVMLISKGADPFAQDKQRRTFLSLAIVRGHWELLMASLNAIRLDYDHESYQVLVTDALVQLISKSVYPDDEEPRRNCVVQLIRQCDDVNFTINDTHERVTDKTLMNWAQTVEEARALVEQGFALFNLTDSRGERPIHSLKYNLELVKFCLDHGTDVDHVDKKGDTLLLTLLSALSHSNWTAPSIVRAIRLCMERGADHSKSDKCRCPCSSNGCSSSSVFSHAFDLGFRSHEVGWVWSFEWASILEDYRGRQAASEVLCSLVRRLKFDQLGMTHVCCHVGRSKPVHHGRFRAFSSREQRPLEEADIDEIIEEESEFIQILDQEMEGLSRLPLERLRKEYMLLLYEEYTKHEAIVSRIQAEQRSDTSASPKPFRYIDYKADVFVDCCISVNSATKASYPVAKILALYVGCLEYEMSKDRVCQEDTHMAGDVWYRNRLRWVVELMGIFKLSLPQIRESIPVLGELGLNQQEKMRKVIREHCTSSIRSMRGCAP